MAAVSVNYIKYA